MSHGSHTHTLRRERLWAEVRGLLGALPRGMDERLIELGTKIESVQHDIAHLQVSFPQKSPIKSPII